MRNILFLCTHNSARSILAEGMVNALGGGTLRAYSAGSHPKSKPNPLALETLSEHGHAIDGYQSKSWDAFAGEDAPVMDAIITVCDDAAGETCPIWPGHPATAHWGIPDPSAVDGDEDERRWAFGVAYARMRARVDDLLALDLDGLSGLELAAELRAIGDKHARAEAGVSEGV